MQPPRPESIRDVCAGSSFMTPVELQYITVEVCALVLREDLCWDAVLWFMSIKVPAPPLILQRIHSPKEEDYHIGINECTVTSWIIYTLIIFFLFHF